MSKVYSATLRGKCFMGDFLEAIVITWPCGRITIIEHEASLWDVGKLIADHLDHCEECQ